MALWFPINFLEVLYECDTARPPARPPARHKSVSPSSSDNKRFPLQITPLLAALLALLAAPAAWAVGPIIVGDSNFSFDPNDGTGGAMANGTNDAYDDAYYLILNGTQFQGATGALSADGRTVSYPLTSVVTGLSASRTFYVPAKDGSANADYGRYLDCVQNTTSAAIQNVDVSITGNLGSDSNTFIYASSNGNTTLDTADTWFGTADSSGHDPTLAHVMGKGVVNPSLAADIMAWHFTIPSLASNKTACFVTYAIQATHQNDAQALATQLATNPDLSGIPKSILPTIKNALDYANVAVLPAAGDAVDSANFDADIILTGTAKALTGGKVAILLNNTDVSSSCGIQQALLDFTGTKTVGRAIHCPAISNLLTKPGKNTFTVTHTSASGGKTTVKAVWNLHPVQALTGP